MGKFVIDSDKISTNYIRINLALAGGMSDADAEEGQVIVMNMKDSTVVGHASLKKHDGEGGFVFRTQKVKEVNFIGFTAGDTLEYLDTKHISAIPLRIIMPVVSYLTTPFDTCRITGDLVSAAALMIACSCSMLLKLNAGIA